MLFVLLLTCKNRKTDILQSIVAEGNFLGETFRDEYYFK